MPEPLEPCRAEAAIALDALLLALERLMSDPAALALLADLRIIEGLAREALGALQEQGNV